MLKVLKCFSRTKTLDEYYLPPLKWTKRKSIVGLITRTNQLNRELNVVSVFARDYGKTPTNILYDRSDRKFSPLTIFNGQNVSKLLGLRILDDDFLGS